MENTRTLHRLRKYKNSISFASVGLLFGIIIFSATSVFQDSLTKYFRNQSTDILNQQFQDNINNAISASVKLSVI